ncbi:MAG: PDP protein [Campylobacteraceae bacterium]|nr:PDP protein [Campylobacteraceae bacterium]
MKILYLVLILINLSFGASVDCTQVFEDRKAELLKEVDNIDEARQSFEALKAATSSLFDKQKAKILEEEKVLKQKKDELTQKQKHIEKLIAKNQKLLDDIKGIKNSKVSEIYTKMKDSAAAAVFENLSASEASAILFRLPAKKISKVLAKMNAQKASKITLKLRQGPPFDVNQTKK